MTEPRPTTETVHRVAIAVFCEAAGVDERDAAMVAEMTIRRALLAQKLPLDEVAGLGTTRPPRCDTCGVDAGLGPAGNITRHVENERWSPEDVDVDADEERPQACAGSGLPPVVDDRPVIGFTRPDGVPYHARIFQVRDVGVAAGNGYLWTRPTVAAYR